uniref:Uncharacterized protein n=1 Tax=Tetranychus urticae TaxID=32264 RepID=T1KH06_TETUR
MFFVSDYELKLQFNPIYEYEIIDYQDAMLEHVQRLGRNE